MDTSTNTQAPVCNVIMNTVQVEQMDHFKYLGSWITSDGRSDIDFKHIIGRATQASLDMKNVLYAWKLGLGVRKHSLNVTPGQSYCMGESWTVVCLDNFAWGSVPGNTDQVFHFEQLHFSKHKETMMTVSSGSKLFALSQKES